MDTASNVDSGNGNEVISGNFRKLPEIIIINANNAGN